MSTVRQIALPQSVSGDADAARLRRTIWSSWRRRLEAQPWRSTPRGPRRRHGPLTEGLIQSFAWLMRGVGLYGRGRRNTLTVRRVDMELACNGLPAEFDGLRILHVTDPHFDLCDGLAEAIAEAIADSPADICVLTGDYRAAVHGPHAAAIRGLEKALSKVSAPLGTWATLGNHDCADMVEPIERLGIGVLINEAATIHRGTARLRLVGLDDVHKFHTPLADEALADHAPSTDGVFGVALVHSPDMAHQAASLGYGLYLSGHTHGGQICLPGGRPVVTHLDSHRRFARGLWTVAAMQGYTSPGAGASSVPLRYFSQSEVTRLTLRSPKA